MKGVTVTKVVRKKQMMNLDEQKSLNMYRTIFQMLCAGKPVVVITTNYEDMDVIFGPYWKVFNLYKNRGLLEVKTLAEATDEDLDGDNTFPVH